MTDDFEKRARLAAERYATGDHSVSFADTHDMAAFIEGTMWARAEMESEYAETAKQQWRKLKAELERANERTEAVADAKVAWPHNPNVEFDGHSVKIKDGNPIRAYLKAEIEIARLTEELERARGEFKQTIQPFALGGDFNTIPILKDEIRSLKLLAENFRAALRKIQRNINLNIDAIGAEVTMECLQYKKWCDDALGGGET